MPVGCTRPVLLALILIGFTAVANAECTIGIPATSAKPCLRDLSPQPFHVNRPASERPTSETRMSADTHRDGDTRRDDDRWQSARVIGAASVASQGAIERESAVVRSMSELRWTDSSDWFRNPPPWLQDIKDSRRRRAPVPLLHLWQSQQTQTLIALGVSHRGQPGVFISRKLPY